MQTQEIFSTQNIQQAVIEKLALLSSDQQQKVLAFAEAITHTDATSSKFRAMFEEAAKDVPPEAWDEIPADASSNIDLHLNQRLER